MLFSVPSSTRASLEGDDSEATDELILIVAALNHSRDSRRNYSRKLTVVCHFGNGSG